MHAHAGRPFMLIYILKISLKKKTFYVVLLPSQRIDHSKFCANSICHSNPNKLFSVLQNVLQLGLVVHAYNPSIRRWRQEDQKLKIISSYIASSGSTWATYDSVIINNKRNCLWFILWRKDTFWKREASHRKLMDELIVQLTITSVTTLGYYVRCRLSGSIDNKDLHSQYACYAHGLVFVSRQAKDKGTRKT